MFGHILKLNCLEARNFSIVRKDFRQQNGTVLAAFTNLSEGEYEDHCIKHRELRPFNVMNDICELNSKTREDPFNGIQLSGVAGWTFKSTDYKQLNVSSSLFTWNLSMNLGYKPLLLSTQVRNQTFYRPCLIFSSFLQ